MSLRNAQLKRDEQLLTRMFRWLHDSERSQILRQIAEMLASRVSLDQHATPVLNPDPISRHADLDESLNNRLRSTRPTDEICEYLSDWVDQTVANAWGDEEATVIFGSCVYDEINAEQILNEVHETAANQHLPEVAAFEPDHALHFIESWREKAVAVLEKNAEASERVVVADVTFTSSDETFYVLNSRSRQSSFLSDSVESVSEKLRADGWLEVGTVPRFDGVAVQLWSHRSGEYLATWDCVDQPIRQKGHG